jgi:class 3 adenylate cyclase
MSNYTLMYRIISKWKKRKTNSDEIRVNSIIKEKRHRALSIAKTRESRDHTSIYKKYTIKCDKDKIITECINDLSLQLEYPEPKFLIGKHISILMNKAVKEKHDKHIFNKSIDYNVDDMNKVIHESRMQLDPKVTCIMGKHDILPCYIDVFINPDYSSTVTVQLINHMDSPLVPQRFMQYINTKSVAYLETYNDVVCMMFDIHDSTVISNIIEPNEMGLLYHEIYKIASDVVNNIAHPYIEIRETCGDSIMMISNAGYMLPSDNYAKLCIDVSKMIIKKANVYLLSILDNLNIYTYLRCGISFGTVSAGVIDGRTCRVFGNQIHLASRLEGACKHNYICVCRRFYEEAMLDENNAVFETCLLKGFGLTELYHVSVF